MGHDAVRRQYNPWPVMDPAHRLAAGVSWIDLRFLGRPRRIAAGLLHGAGGRRDRRSRADQLPADARGSARARGHAAATRCRICCSRTSIWITRAPPARLRGAIPHIRVVVHRHGRAAPGRSDEAASRARRGSTAPTWIGCGAPSSRAGAQLQIVDGGEALDVAGRSVERDLHAGACQASRHLLRRDERHGVGRRRGRCLHRRRGYVLPPTPPPDMDLAAWRGSIERLEAMQAGHAVPDPLRAGHDAARAPAVAGREPGDDGGAGARVAGACRDRRRAEGGVRRSAAARTAPAHGRSEAQSYESAAAFGLSWAGLARYLRRIERVS